MTVVQSPRPLLAAAAVVGGALLAGCTALPTGEAPRLRVDTTFTATSQDSRVQHLILHFTAEDFPRSLKILTQGPVSSHYLVSESQGETPPKIYRLVDESRRAYHAGVSWWKGAASLNASSIGIEIVNRGPRKQADGSILFDEFDPAQIDLVIALCRQIMKDHAIRPDRVLGHSDIAPGRKNDPGPKFPWKKLADAGLIAWPDEAMTRERMAAYQQALPDVRWFQQKLMAHGFNVPPTGMADRVTQDALTAFQLKYRPANFDGNPDAETAALLDVVTRADGFRVRGVAGSLMP